LHGTRKQTAKTKRNRSAVTSGRRLFAERTSTDSPRGRRFVDLVNRYTTDCGGDDRISETTRTIIRRIAFLQCVLEDREADYARSGTVTLEQTLEYQRTSNTMSRLMKKVGLFNSKPGADDDDDMSPLEYMKRRGRKREHLTDDEEDD
jgi:hypothetical protein